MGLELEDIHYISTSTVYPATYKISTQAQRIDLTPWDLQLLPAHYIQKGLLFLKPTANTLKDHSLIRHLEASLSRSLDAFFPLAGSLSIIQNNDNTVTYFLSCNNTGAQLIHAEAKHVTVANVLKPYNVPAIVRSFFPLNGIKNHQGISEPLLSVQVTELVDGIFIGCSMNHVVGDGYSFWQFINHWSDVSSNPSLNHLLSPPSLKRWFVDESHSPIRFSSPVFDEDTTDAFSRIPSLREHVFHLSKETVQKLKNRANEEMGTTRISSFQAVLAHLWRSVIRCTKNIDGKEETKLYILADMRQRLNPPLPKNYLGNAIQAGDMKMTINELSGNGVGWIALKMRKAIDDLAEGKLAREYLKAWVEDPVFIDVNALASNSFVPSSSPRFKVYECDFGWGKPVAVRSGVAHKIDGLLTFNAGVEDGSMDIEVCLLAEKLEALEKDEEFMQTVTLGQNF
ncbi:hypothetical protein RJ641_004534 [Dillenia turbinata]|uniref:HXXXD-type acyl-transferase family protein n=1 Tax=Dillenia turbinata TaxID=194707 RepID=A0AAN8VA75_9MAGN